MKSRFCVLFVATIMACFAVSPSAAAPDAGPCVAGGGYNPACDADQNGQINITDIQLTAGHWNQTGTFTSDSNHNHLGQTWIGASNPLKIQGTFGAPDYAALVLNNTSAHGLAINNVGLDGIYVGTAGAYGMVVNDAAWDGVYVNVAGNPSAAAFSTLNNGFEVAGAEGDGLYVGRADQDGVYVSSTGLDGVRVQLASGNGVYVHSAGATGVNVLSAAGNGVYANTLHGGGQWGLYTPDAIHGSNVLLHSLSIVAQVTGPNALSPGDIVAATGITDPVTGSTVHTPQVRLAGGAFTNVVGVVESHLALVQQPSRAQPTNDEAPAETPATELRSVDGPAGAGDYVAITVMGAGLVKVQAGDTILAGQRLTAGTGGSVRVLQSRTLDGMVVTEGAPVLGVALDVPKDGMVWVLVNPQ